ncbi:MAG: hypothetical protein AAGH19_04675 [Pseudomonadota bacterium]
MTSEALHIKSAQHEAQIRRYHAIEYKPHWFWLHSDDVNCGDHVYHGCDLPDHKSQGFGGATLTFLLVGGGELKLKGPWKASPGGMLKATGVDVTDKLLTRAIIGPESTLDLNGGGYFGTRTFINPGWYEPDFVLGRYERGRELADALATALGRPLRYYVETGGGSHSGTAMPSEAA